MLPNRIKTPGKYQRVDGKYVVQALLAPSIGNLYVDIVTKTLGMTPSDHVKSLIDTFLRKSVGKRTLKRLKAEDAKFWEEVVRRRIEARKKKN